MATHSSVLAWRIPGTEEPGGLSSQVAQSWTRLKRLSSTPPFNVCRDCSTITHLLMQSLVSSEFIKIMLAAITNNCKISVVSHRRVPYSPMMHVV